MLWRWPLPGAAGAAASPHHALAQQQIVETRLHDIVHGIGFTKVVVQGRADPGRCAGFRKHRTLERGEIAEANESRTAGDCRCQRLVVDTAKESSQAITATAGQRHVGPARRRAVERGKARRVVTGEPHMG